MPKVLIVDDDRTTVKLLHTLLEMDGFDIVSTVRGADALKMAQQEQPDLLLIDYHLTDIDGVEVIKTLRALPEFSTLPIVMASGLDVGDEALAAGANHFMVKPYEPNDLAPVFEALIKKYPVSPKAMVSPNAPTPPETSVASQSPPPAVTPPPATQA